MTRTERSPRWGTPVILVAGAVALWLTAAVVDRRTEVVIEQLGDHLRFSVAGTDLVLKGKPASVTGIAIQATDAVDPPVALSAEVAEGGQLTRLLLSGTLDVDDPGHTPVGDWWVDGRSARRVVFDQPLELDGAFAVRLVLGGRFGNDLTIALSGADPLHFVLRRGLLDNYLAVYRADGALLEVTTLDPTPAADLLAIAAQLLRAVAAACLLAAFVALVAAVAPGDRAAATPPTTRPPPRRLALIAALALATTGAALSAWVAVDVLAGLPHQIDEVVYLLQARWLLDGEVAPAATPLQHHLTVPFTYPDDGRWLGHYPIGWPATLAVGLAAGAPHLVATVLGAVLVVLVFLVGRELDDELTGLAAATLAAVSPMARLLSGSMFPHVACAVLVALALWLLLQSRRRIGWWYGAGAGLALGCCLAVRPMTAVVAALVLGGWLVIEAATEDGSRQTWATIVAAVAAGLPASVPTLLHNAAVTGDPLSLPYSLAKGTMYGLANIPFGIRNLDAILRVTSPGFFGWGWPLWAGVLVAALPLGFAALPFALRRARREDWLLLALLLAVAVGHLPTRANGLHGYGARYVLDVGVCLYVLTGRGFRELARWARPSRPAVLTVVALFLALNLATLASLPLRLGLFRGYYGVTGELERQLAATDLEEAVILVDGDDWRSWGEGARLMTGPRRHAILIAADTVDASVLESSFPDRPVLRWDGAQLRPEKAAVH